MYLITDGEINESNFHVKTSQTLQIIQIAVDAGVQLIQIREKNLPARQIFQLAAAAKKSLKNLKPNFWSMTAPILPWLPKRTEFI